MEYNPLGQSGLRVPALSFGTATFGGGNDFFKAWGSTDASGAARFHLIEAVDAALAWKLDRLGLSLPHSIETVAALEKREVGFRSIAESIDTTTSGGRLVFHLFGALGQFERDLIQGRSRAGLALHRTRAVIGSALMVILLTACQSQPRLAYASATPADEPSKPVSSCGYSLGFSENSTAITVPAHSLLEQAASEARRRKTTRITVSAHYARVEGGAFQDKRARAIADDLERLGFTISEISVVHVYDLPPGRPTAYVFVCDLADEKELQNTPPSDPEQKAPYKVGAVELRIPVRYLSPYDWRDIPFEPRNYGEVSLYFGWPGLQDRMSDVMQHCTRTYLNGCADRVLVKVVPAGSRLPDSVLRQLPKKNELVPIHGELYGGAWFVYKNWERRVQAVLQTRDEDGSSFVVSCRWLEFNTPPPDGWQPSLEGVEALTRAPRSYCQMAFALTPALDANVTFGAKNISDWHAIRTEVRRLVPQWQLPPSSSSTNLTKPL